ncbi:putative MKRN2 opposite strand protein [Hypsibius exemplaris]|uniref:MKRN2 opposite strand protein n=1 Tax=Hypsibius exemplaris TaxID=2072580 RepID=A0A1W0WRK8_HYPEX|nr:putative MKRN2 opposite strand protein [Hypsibius exemplaris]
MEYLNYDSTSASSISDDNGIANSSDVEDEESPLAHPLPMPLPPPSVVCFQHCVRGRNIFCTAMPSTCPSCHQTLRVDSFLLPPLCIFAPWTSSLTVPCSIVLRTTSGSFLREYNGFEDLHVGISDSNGAVTHYSEDGMQTDAYWEECLSVTVDHSPAVSRCRSDRPAPGVAGDSSRENQCGWDNMISMFKISWRKTIGTRGYCERANNCFDFVWAFVTDYCKQFGDPKTALNLCRTKDCFTEHHFLPVVEKALKFNQLIIGVERDGVLVLENIDNGQ